MEVKWMREEVFISLERMREMAHEPGLAMVMGFDGRWKYSVWAIYKSRRESCKQ